MELESVEKAKKKQHIHVSARVRKALPFEDSEHFTCITYDKNAIGIPGFKSLVGDDITDFYQFDKVFQGKHENKDIFNELCRPLCDTTLNNGYNSIFIAYGQTGSGKTYTMLGKQSKKENQNENVIGVLPMCLQYFLNDERVKTISIQSVEVYGTSPQKVEIFDLQDPQNINCKWKDKQSTKHEQFISIDIDDPQKAMKIIESAREASHFAKTGANPQSSRGHVIFIFTITRTDKLFGKSHFVAVDLAGSEGESALTAEFAKSVSKKALQTRRLEAGMINYGLSQLQKVFQEIRMKHKKLDFKESGLRKVLHPYIGNETLISVLFTFSPSNSNIHATRSTLRTAHTVSMIEIIPKTNVYHDHVKKKRLKKNKEDKDELIRILQDKIKVMDLKIHALKSKRKKKSIWGHLKDKMHADINADDIELVVGQDKDDRIARLEKKCEELQKKVDDKTCCKCFGISCYKT